MEREMEDTSPNKGGNEENEGKHEREREREKRKKEIGRELLRCKQRIDSSRMVNWR
jgi:hypothetical protein